MEGKKAGYYVYLRPYDTFMPQKKGADIIMITFASGIIGASLLGHINQVVFVYSPPGFEK